MRSWRKDISVGNDYVVEEIKLISASNVIDRAKKAFNSYLNDVSDVNSYCAYFYGVLTSYMANCIEFSVLDIFGTLDYGVIDLIKRVTFGKVALDAEIVDLAQKSLKLLMKQRGYKEYSYSGGRINFCLKALSKYDSSVCPKENIFPMVYERRFMISEKQILDYNVSSLGKIKSFTGLSKSSNLYYSWDIDYDEHDNEREILKGYPFLLVGNNIHIEDIDKLRNVISKIFEICIVKVECVDYDYNQGEGFKSKLFLERFDVSPCINFYDRKGIYYLELRYISAPGYTGGFCKVIIAFDSNEFQKGKLKVVDDVNIIGDCINYAVDIKVLGRNNVSYLLSFIRKLINFFDNRFDNVVFEEIMIIPFSTKEIIGVGNYISEPIYCENTIDYSEEEFCRDNYPHCRGLITML